MSGWKHTFEVAACDWTGDTDMEYPVCGAADGGIGCGHTKVEPDPASPCGYVSGIGEPCENPAWQPHERPTHTHVPTLCKNCQHAIARTDR